MSQARKQRRLLEKAFGLRKKSSNFFSKEQTELRERRRKAGEEIHRQNLERMRSGGTQDKSNFLEDTTSEFKEPVDVKININTSVQNDLEDGPSGSSM